ncbi:MAG: hypothetical protein M3O35_22265 [Acidobacteriota bacterium]|nr:hypothetical protein [Acidobacteriota bacterium]
MSPRKIVRIVLSLGILALLWLRVGREWLAQSPLWIVGTLVLSVILLLVTLSAIIRVRKPSERVPKKPLGL